MITSTGIIVVVMAVLSVDAPAVVPQFTDIVQHAVKAMQPAQAYEVDVVQTITKGKPAEGQPEAAPAEGPKKFVSVYAPSSGLSVKRDSGQAGDSGGPPPGVKIQIDVPRFLQEMTKWPEIAVVSETFDGRACYKVSGKNPQGPLAAELWVDQERWCVPKLAIEAKGRRFAEAVFEYRRVNDTYWLLSKATVTHAQDRSVAVQDFGEYRFGKD